ncbi:MAG TPA: VOC family protein [Thermoplasmata archaeon]|jgi:catechol 2,3-dioxygenase-like lactoylglutathione lyase family enzyme|nr:VOC family protein [Thermoplasmata archaeon]
MTKLQRVSEVSVFTKNQKLAKEFYTKKLGLKVRSSMPKMDYLQLGATKTGEDAGIDLWQPDPKWGSEMYEQNLKSVGIVTGIGLLTSNLEKTVTQLAGRGVKVEKDSETFARVRDPDGNVLFVQQEPRPKVKRTGLQSVSWVTVAVRDEAKAAAFFKTLGFKGRKIPGESREEGQPMTIYQLGGKGTAILPFAPRREMYENAAEYDTDLAHVGEDTGIGIEVDDAFKVEEKLRAQGVTISAKAELQDWGGVRMRIKDPDGNQYMLYNMKRR